MPHLLFKLNNVPEDELIDVRRLLDENYIEYYETDAGRFGISLAAIWLRDDGEIERAQELLHKYQEQRYREARADYEQQQRDGTAETMLQRALHQPLRTVIYLAIIVTILYFMIAPFWLHAS